MRTHTHLNHRITRGIRLGAVVCAAALALAACSSTKNTGTPAASPTATASAPGTRFNAATVSGLGSVVVDASGRTVYALTSGTNKDVTCDDASGCTKAWPDLPLPAGTAAPAAGTGIQASMLSTMKLSDGETYPTYNGYLLYEFSGDSGSGQGNGEGISSFGGTWYALSPAGTPITAKTSSTSSNGGY
jgi:predicted lipoprotein with Yx(FWY)xxD motif